MREHTVAPQSFPVASSGHSASQWALSSDSTLQKLTKVAVFHVLEHGVDRFFLVTHSEQPDDVDVLQARHCPRVLVKLCPITQQISLSISVILLHNSLKLRTKKSRALSEAPSQSHGMPLALWDHLPPNTSEHTPALTSARGRYSIYLSRKNGRLSWPRWPVTYRDGLPAHRRSPIQVLTRPAERTRDLLITSPTP